MDWMTLAITATGAVIFCLWIIIPIQEYRTIFQRLRHRDIDDSNGGERHP